MPEPRAAPSPPHPPARLGQSKGVTVTGVTVPGVVVTGMAVTRVAVTVMFLLLRTCGWQEERDNNSSVAGSGSGSARSRQIGGFA